MTSEHDPAGENNPTPQAPPAVASSPPPPTNIRYEIVCKTEKDRWDEIKPFVEVLGIALLAIYTAYTIKMYHGNKTAADAARE